MDFAVIKLAGKQFLVREGSVIEVEADVAAGAKSMVIGEVLLRSIGGKLEIGVPLVNGAKVSAQVVSVGKGEKIRVLKFKAKSRYRRKTGFRPVVTKLKITSLGDNKKNEAEDQRKPLMKLKVNEIKGKKKEARKKE